VNNGTDAGNLYHKAVELAAGRSIANKLPNRHGKTDGQILWETLEAHGLAAELHAAAAMHLDELSRLRFERGEHRTLCAGVIPALTAAARAGWTNALLTGNGRARSFYKITGAGVDEHTIDWEHSYFGNVTPIRSDLTRAAAAELDAPIVIIGDTPNDGVAADAAGLPFLAVATGAYTAEELRATSALIVIDDLESGLDALLDQLSALR
jgi:phosphoglycolate phosphatase-like HAD superfamily hydrolase